MALYLIRTGQHGEYEQKFLESEHIYLTWESIKENLSNASSKSEMRKLIEKSEPIATKAKISNLLG